MLEQVIKNKEGFGSIFCEKTVVSKKIKSFFITDSKNSMDGRENIGGKPLDRDYIVLEVQIGSLQSQVERHWINQPSKYTDFVFVFDY